MISLPSLKSWPVCDLDPRVSRLWWLFVLPRISKRDWAAGVQRREYWGKEEHFSPPFVGCSAYLVLEFRAGIPGFKVWMYLRQRSESAGQAGRQRFWLSSFPPEHTAQVRVWDFRGIPLVFGDGMGRVGGGLIYWDNCILGYTDTKHCLLKNVELRWWDCMQVVKYEKHLLLKTPCVSQMFFLTNVT